MEEHESITNCLTFTLHKEIWGLIKIGPKTKSVS
jgi:hypothetical protein